MIGEMKDRIILRNPKKTSNGRGGWSIDYLAGEFMTVWADANLLGIGDQIRYMQFDEEASMQFIIRENPFFNSSTRIEFDGKMYSVVNYAFINTRFYDIRAREV